MELCSDRVTPSGMTLTSKLLKAVKRPIPATVKEVISYVSNIILPYSIYVSADFHYDLYHKKVSNIKISSWLSRTRIYST